MAFTLIELLVVISIIALLIGILLPALHAARITTQRLRSSHQARQVGLAMAMFAEHNNGYYPGLDSRNRLRPAGEIEGSATSGGTPGARYVIMLTRNYFPGETIISPLETKTPWRTTGTDISTAHFSYAMLALDLDADGQRDNVRRVAEWRNTINTQAMLLSDRNTGEDAEMRISSIHTEPNSGDWRGTVLFGDGRAEFVTRHPVLTRYGNAAMVGADNFFAEDDDDSGQSGNDAVMVYQDERTLIGQQ